MSYKLSGHSELPMHQMIFSVIVMGESAIPNLPISGAMVVCRLHIVTLSNVSPV